MVEEFLYIFFQNAFSKDSCLSKQIPCLLRVVKCRLLWQARGREFIFEKSLLYGTLLKPPATQTPEMSSEQLRFL